LAHRKNFRPARKQWSVGRTKRGALGEGNEKIIDEPRTPASYVESSALDFFDLHLWENETAAAKFTPPITHRWSAAIEPESKRESGASLWVGNAVTSKVTDPTNASVVIALITMPSAWFNEWRPIRCVTTVGTNSTAIKAGSSQIGPTMTQGGKAK